MTILDSDTLKEDYKLLGLGVNATAYEARRSYHKMKALYAEGSLATYSLMTAEQREEMLDRIERAYMRISMDIEAQPTADTAPLFSTEAVQPAPPERGESIGTYLRQCRESLGLTLRDVASMTKIRTTYLEHIEKENLEDLPAPVYLRGFVLEFARVLGLPDAESITTDYLKLLGEDEA